MDWIGQFAGMNSFAAIVIIAFIVFLFVGIKKGYFSFSGKGLDIGLRDKERQVMQRQTTFVHGALDAICNRLILEHPDFDGYKTKWIVKCVELEMIRSIHYNHIENTDGYRDDRVTSIVQIVQKKSDNPWVFGSDFLGFVKENVSAGVAKLVDIRKMVG